MTAQRILVAEDDPITRRFVVSLLRDKGYDVIEAGDGEDAVRLAVEETPQLILTDLVLPFRDGYGILRTLRAHELTRDLPVLVLSMRDREDDIVRGFEDGADDYVVKPFNARELIARVRKLLRNRPESP